jgi:hypothetical protein
MGAKSQNSDNKQDVLIEVNFTTDYKNKNCTNCKYAESQINGDVNCNKHVFSEKTVLIPHNKKLLDCPCHSDCNREESRYSRSNSNIFSSDDVCFICRRDLLPNKDMIRRDKKTHKDICVICFEKTQVKEGDDNR